jgi:hypothetical protein
MALTFPTALFGFLDQEVDIERQTLKGGVALSGEQDISSTDGGGRVFAEFSNGSLVDRAKVLAWRALLGTLEEGVTPMVVPFCDIRHQPYGGEHRVPHSDDTPFSDGSLYTGGGPVASSAGAVARRGTITSLNIQLAQPLIGGEWFTVSHPTEGDRAYKVRSIDAQTPTTATIRFSPPAREAWPAGTVIDFRDPRCLMVQDGRASSGLQGRRMTVAAIRFVEAP